MAGIAAGGGGIPLGPVAQNFRAAPRGRDLRHHHRRSDPRQPAAFFEVPAEELAGKAVDDPYAAVRVDAALARHALPPGRLVSGLVYDVTTGLIRIVDPAAKE